MQPAVWFVTQAEAAMVSDRQTFCETMSMTSVILCFKNGTGEFDIPRSLGAPAVPRPSPGRRRRTPSLPRARRPTQELLSFWATTASLVGYGRIGVCLAFGSGNRRRRVGVPAASPLKYQTSPPGLACTCTVDGTGSTLRFVSPYSYWDANQPMVTLASSSNDCCNLAWV